VTAVAYRLLGDMHEAMDARQQVLLRVCQSAGTFDGRSSVSTWVHRIVVNVCRDGIRKRNLRRRHMAKLTRLAERPARPQGSDAEGPQPDSIRLAAVVADAVGALPQDEREAVVLKHYAALTFAEMADVLEVPASTLKSRVLRGLERLRSALGEADCVGVE